MEGVAIDFIVQYSIYYSTTVVLLSVERSNKLRIRIDGWMDGFIWSSVEEDGTAKQRQNKRPVWPSEIPGYPADTRGC